MTTECKTGAQYTSLFSAPHWLKQLFHIQSEEEICAQKLGASIEEEIVCPPASIQGVPARGGIELCVRLQTIVDGRSQTIQK